MDSTAQYLNSLTDQIIGAAVSVHRALGPGLLESAYEACLYYDWSSVSFASNDRSRYRWSTRASSWIARTEWIWLWRTA